MHTIRLASYVIHGYSDNEVGSVCMSIHGVCVAICGCLWMDQGCHSNYVIQGYSYYIIGPYVSIVPNMTSLD